MARLVFDDATFTVEHNEVEHTCLQIDANLQSKPVLSEDLIHEIRKLYISKIRMPQRVLIALRAIKKDLNKKLYNQEPTSNQIKHQISKLKIEFKGKGEIALTKLEKFCEESSSIPEDDDEGYVITYKMKYAEDDIQQNSDDSFKDGDSDDSSERHFFMLYSTKRLLRLASESKLICCDTTFKFVWLGYPAILIGTVTTTWTYKSSFMPLLLDSHRQKSRKLSLKLLM